MAPRRTRSTLLRLRRSLAGEGNSHRKTGSTDSGNRGRFDSHAGILPSQSAKAYVYRIGVRAYSATFGAGLAVFGIVEYLIGR